MNKGNIVDLLKQSNFSSEFIRYIENNFPENYSKKFNDPYHMNYLCNPLLDLSPEKRLIESLAQLISLKKHYIIKGIPLVHLYKSIYDLSYRLERYYKKHGTYGLSERDIRWLSPLYRADIFDLGSLRFEVSYFTYEEIERSDYDYMPLNQKWKNQFPEGTPIITIHILKDTDFRPDKVDEAFAQAIHFFKRYFSEHDYQAFVCRTWLLYGRTREILDEDSNIVSFSNRFKIIAEHNNPKQSLDRIYGTSDLDVIEGMKKKSSLEKVAYKNLSKLGVAAGIIYKKSYSTMTTYRDFNFFDY